MSIATLRNLLHIWRIHPVTRGNLTKAVARFLRWQIVSRLHKGKLVVPYVARTQLIAAQGQTGVTGNIYFGLAEFPEMAFLLHYLRADDLFVDVGANMGVFSILASGVVGARSIAFEPIPTTVLELQEQLRLNDLIERVDIRPVALGSEIGSVRFYDTLGTTNRVVAESEEPISSLQVPQSTLDHELNGLEPALIKMDVEGYEYFILKGAGACLRAPALNAIILEVHEGTSTYDVDRGDLEELLGVAGFKPYSYDAAKRELREICFAEASAHKLSDNVLMIRDAEAVRRRVVKGPAFNTFGRSF